MKITEFLLARIAEDEETARVGYQGEWETQGRSVWGGSPRDGGFDTYDEGGIGPGECNHMVRWQPSRVLRECEAKRRIVADRHASAECMRALAAVYADHPDYDPAWETAITPWEYEPPTHEEPCSVNFPPGFRALDTLVVAKVIRDSVPVTRPAPRVGIAQSSSGRATDVDDRKGAPFEGR